MNTKWILVVFTLIVFSLFGVLVWLVLNPEQVSFKNSLFSEYQSLKGERVEKKSSFESNENEKNINISDYSLFYTAAPLNVDMVPTLFAYDFVAKTSRKINKRYKSSIYSFASDGENIVCFDVNEKDFKKHNYDRYKATKLIYKKDREIDCTPGEIIDMPKAFKNATIIGDPDLLGSKMLVSVFKEDPTLDKRHNPETWTIYLFDLKAKKLAEIDKGMYPHWVKGGSIIYIKRDGVYLLDYNNSDKPRKIYHLDKTDFANSITVSFLTDTVVWNIPQTKKVYILKLVRKGNKILGARLEKVIDELMVRDIISSDGKLIFYLKPEKWHKWYTGKRKIDFVVKDIKTERVLYITENFQKEWAPYSFNSREFLKSNK